MGTRTAGVHRRGFFCFRSPTMNQPTPDVPEEAELAEDEAPACVMVFNASDPSGAGGLAADAPIVVTGAGFLNDGDMVRNIAAPAAAPTKAAR